MGVAHAMGVLICVALAPHYTNNFYLSYSRFINSNYNAIYLHSRSSTLNNICSFIDFSIAGELTLESTVRAKLYKPSFDYTLPSVITQLSFKPYLLSPATKGLIYYMLKTSIISMANMFYRSGIDPVGPTNSLASFLAFYINWWFVLCIQMESVRYCIYSTENLTIIIFLVIMVSVDFMVLLLFILSNFWSLIIDFLIISDSCWFLTFTIILLFHSDDLTFIIIQLFQSDLHSNHWNIHKVVLSSIVSIHQWTEQNSGGNNYIASLEGRILLCFHIGLGKAVVDNDGYHSLIYIFWIYLGAMVFLDDTRALMCPHLH